MSFDNTESWLHLLNAPGLGFARINKLLDYFGSASEVLRQSNFPTELKIPQSVIHHLRQVNNDDIHLELNWLDKPNNHLLTIENTLYPPQLLQSNDPPAALFVKGDLNALLLPQLAVVGSRNATQGGLNNTLAFCYDLAQKGLVITSGLATGIDTQAHQAAIDAKGQTVAVMGTGINMIYPKTNQQLAKTIANQGAVVSELPFNTPPHAHNFPRRNRIISGLSLGALVIEATNKSGTLITARLSMENNRPVMAIPGSIHNPMARGCHHLIKQGAKLVESAQDIFEELAPNIAMLSDQLKSNLNALEQPALEKTPATPNIELTESQQHIFQQLDFHPTSFDAIVEQTGFSSATVASDLLILELSGMIEKLPGAKYQKT